ncbi:unnamed protein product [Nippostrongylus brasiliensis]|uniref:rRNA methyltransferase n=1 Tax=Nippostrongylus brasiliensis TaxID=27835 RepID=A0A0N4YX61_NIPBR|nr:unnamed protein product [Nippostrongylus brasiliensis]
MGKQRKGGLPYLRTSLDIDWESGRGVAVDVRNTLLSEVFRYLEENGCRCDSADSFAENTCAGFGLQACLDLVKTDSSPIVLLDAKCPRPNAVSNALGLYFNNYSDSAKVYCLPGVEELLRSKLNRRTNALVLRNCPEELRMRLTESFTPLRFHIGKISNTYTSVSLVKSKGKPDKVKK